MPAPAMFAALALSLAQLGDARIVAVLAKSLALTLALLAALGAALWFAGTAVVRAGGGGDALAGVAGVIALAGGVALGWLLFRGLAIGVVGLFADDVVGAVEARHYPAAHAAARRIGPGEGIRMGAAGLGRTLLFNVAAAPVYLLLLATGVGTAVAFFAVNAVLLGRDLGDMVAVRHRARADLPAWRRTTRGRRLGLGAFGTALLLVPGLNLVAPVLADAMATHLYHRSRP